VSAMSEPIDDRDTLVRENESLRRRIPTLSHRVVFVTGGAFTPNARGYLEQVDNISIDKPFDSTNLLKMVADWVAAAQAEDRAERL
jgi:hypothetical protein